MKLELGYKYREAFLDFHKRTQPRAAMVCHRRAGKTVASVNDLQDAALSSTLDRPRYAYVAPQLKQARNVAWDHARAAARPLGNAVEFNEALMRIYYKRNGAQLQLFGSDDPDSLRGMYLDGVILDEAADMDPRVWPEVISPMLIDRKGFAVFIGTPRGHNAFWSICKEAEENQDTWFWKRLKASESGILSAEELALQRRQMTEDQYRQEFECDFEASVHGAYYAKLINQAREGGRICSVPYDPAVPVCTAWDLGYTDPTAIWFAQRVGKETHIIDYYENNDLGLGHYVNVLREKGYTYSRHILPPDAEAKELGTGKSRVETLRSLGLNELTILGKQEIADGVNAVQLLLPKCWFDKARCDRGIEALTLHRSQTDPRFIDPLTKMPLLKPAPVHDWTSHAADAFRYLAEGIDRALSGGSFWGPLDYPKKSMW